MRCAWHRSSVASARGTAPRPSIEERRRRQMIVSDTTTLNLTVGEHLLGLAKDRSWLIRRVDTVSFVDEVSSLRQSTFDIDTARVARTQPDGFVRSGFVALPLMVLEKQLLIDSDLRDEAARPLHVASRHDDSYITWCITAARAQQSSIDLVARPRVATAVRAIIENFPKGLPVDRREVAPEWEGLRVPGWDEADTCVWESLFLNVPLRDWIHRVTYGFMLVTYVPVREDISVIKFSTRADVVPKERIARRAAVRLGWLPARLAVPIPESIEADRRHLRLRVPDGLEWSSIRVERLVAALRGRQAPDHRDQDASCQVMLTPDRAHVYISSREPWHGLTAILGIHVPVRGFLRASVFSALLNAGLLGAGIRYHTDLRALGGAKVEAAVPILLIAPTLFSAYLVRTGEHALLGRLLRWGRYFLVLSMGAVYTAAIAAVMYLETKPRIQEQFWAWCFGISAVSAGVLLLGFLASGFQAIRLRRHGIRQRFRRKGIHTRTVPIRRHRSTLAPVEAPPPPATGESSE